MTWRQGYLDIPLANLYLCQLHGTWLTPLPTHVLEIYWSFKYRVDLAPMAAHIDIRRIYLFLNVEIPI